MRQGGAFNQVRPQELHSFDAMHKTSSFRYEEAVPAGTGSS
jgi:hypothetical protein